MIQNKLANETLHIANEAGHRFVESDKWEQIDFILVVGFTGIILIGIGWGTLHLILYFKRQSSKIDKDRYIINGRSRGHNNGYGRHNNHHNGYAKESKAKYNGHHNDNNPHLMDRIRTLEKEQNQLFTQLNVMCVDLSEIKGSLKVLLERNVR